MTLDIEKQDLIKIFLNSPVGSKQHNHEFVGKFIFADMNMIFKWDEAKLIKLDEEDLIRLYYDFNSLRW